MYRRFSVFRPRRYLLSSPFTGLVTYLDAGTLQIVCIDRNWLKATSYGSIRIPSALDQTSFRQRSVFRQESARPIGDYLSNANMNRGEHHEPSRNAAGTGTRRHHSGICLRSDAEQPDWVLTAVTYGVALKRGVSAASAISCGSLSLTDSFCNCTDESTLISQGCQISCSPRR